MIVLNLFNSYLFFTGHAALTLRSRLRCIIIRKNADHVTEKNGPNINNGNATERKHPQPTNLLVLNEVVIDRGPSPYLSNIDLFLDGKHITSVSKKIYSNEVERIYQAVLVNQ